jgi:hypothetical protein
MEKITLSPKEKFWKAVEKSEIKSFLRGENGYGMSMSSMETSVSVLFTDVNRALVAGVYEAYKEDKRVKEMFENTLLEMLEGDASDVYIALEYIVRQQDKECNKNKAFEMNAEPIIVKLQEGLKRNRELLQYKVPVPDMPNGVIVWHQVERFNKRFEEQHNVTLLVE